MFDTYQEIFNNRAWSYHQAMQSVPDARRLEFEIALEYLQPETGQWIVDMPSGGGYLKQYIHDPSVNLLFVETTPEFARHCPQSSHCRRLIGGFDSLPVQKNSVERLLSLAALHHVEDKSRFFRECHRVLSSCGRLVIGDVYADTAQARFLNEFVDEFNSMGHKGDFLTADIDSQIADNGFDVCRQQQHPFCWFFSSQQQMLAYCRDLFGIDLADDKVLMQGIEEYLTPEWRGDCVTLQWSLHYICARPLELGA